MLYVDCLNTKEYYINTIIKNRFGQQQKMTLGRMVSDANKVI